MEGDGTQPNAGQMVADRYRLIELHRHEGGLGRDPAIEREGPLTPAETARVISQVASALDRPHALGVVRRDLKPANVFLTPHASGVMAEALLRDRK